MSDDDPNKLDCDPGLRRRWFVRGVSFGMLFFAALNAASYFVRSEEWGSLIRPGRSFSESLGFPLVVWESQNYYGGMFVDYARIGVNFLVALAISVSFGLLLSRFAGRMDRALEQLQSNEPKSTGPAQFSISGIMIATVVIAVIVALAKKFAASPETLLAIYLGGPAALVAIAMLPRQLSWEKRVAIILPTAIMLISIAVVVGVSLGMEFDKVLFGVFICWTPPSVLTAIGLTVWLLFAGDRESNSLPK